MTFLLMLAGAVLAPFLCAAIFGEHTGWTSAIGGLFVGYLLAHVIQGAPASD